MAVVEMKYERNQNMLLNTASVAKKWPVRRRYEPHVLKEIEPWNITITSLYAVFIIADWLLFSLWLRYANRHILCKLGGVVILKVWLVLVPLLHRSWDEYWAWNRSSMGPPASEVRQLSRERNINWDSKVTEFIQELDHRKVFVLELWNQTTVMRRRRWSWGLVGICLVISDCSEVNARSKKLSNPRYIRESIKIIGAAFHRRRPKTQPASNDYLT